MVYDQMGQLPHPMHPLDAAEYERLQTRIAWLGNFINEQRGVAGITRVFTQGH